MRIWLSWMHRLVQFLVWTRGWRMFFCEKLREKLVSRNDAIILYKCTHRMIFAAVSTSLWARHRAFWCNLLNLLTIVEDKMDRWSIDIACLLPCTLTSMNTSTVYFHDIVAFLTSRQRLKRGHIFVICDRLGVHVYSDVCIVMVRGRRNDDRVYKKMK